MTAITSIAHRVSGVVLFLSMPAALLLLLGVKKASYWPKLVTFMSLFPARLALWVMACALMYHLLAGIRHAWMDGLGCHGPAAARRSAWALIASTLILALLMGVRLW